MIRCGFNCPCSLVRERLFDKCRDINNQGDTSVSKDGGPRNANGVLVTFSKGFDDCLVASDDPVTGNSDTEFFDPDDHDLFGRRQVSGCREEFPEPDKGDEISPDGDHVPSMGASHVILAVFDTLFDVGHGEDVMRVPDHDHQSVNDGECQRKGECDPASLATFARDVDRSTKRFNLPFDDIHSHATPRNTRDLGRGRKTGVEDLGKDFFVSVLDVAFEQSALDGP